MRVSLLPPVSAALTATEVASLGATTEELGWDGFWYADERFYRDTYSVLATCALRTSAIRLGPAVTDPFTRHPVTTAASVATLNELSSGRAVLGIGAGIGGFKNLGIVRHRPAVAVREAVEIVRSLLAGDRITFHGKQYSLTDAELQFSAQEVPVFVAADGPAMLRMAGETADAVIIYHTPTREALAEKLAVVREGSKKRASPRTPRIVSRLDVCVAPDAQSALAWAKLRVARYLWARYPEIPYVRLHRLEMPRRLRRAIENAGEFTGTHDLEAFRPIAREIPEDLVHPIAIAGTPRDVVERIHGLREIGVDEAMIYLVPVGTQTIAQALEHLHSAGLAAGETPRS